MDIPIGPIGLGSRTKRAGTAIVVVAALFLAFVPTGQAPLYLPADPNERIQVKFESAYANLDDRQGTAVGCEKVKVEVPWIYDGSGDKAKFDAWIDGGTTPSTGDVLVDSNGELWPEKQMCVGQQTDYGGDATGWKSNGGTTYDSDTGNVLAL